MFIITIDTGTTNTRIRLWQGKQKIAEHNQPIGVKNIAITGRKEVLIDALKHMITAVLNEGNISDYHNVTIIASGMITSNIGLFEIPYMTVPVSLQKLAHGIVKQIIPEIIAHPIWFIPGIKNDITPVTLENCESMDIMRGEETEAVGVLSLLNLHGPALIILPGSHSKFIKVDKNQQITGCATTLAGEFLNIITCQTILADSLNHQYANFIEEAYLLKGVEYYQKVGITRGCFSIRILDLFTQLTVNQKANFLLGLVLAADLQTIKNSQVLMCQSDTTIVICGKKILRQALHVLMKKDTFFSGKHIVFEEEKHPPLSSIGAITLFNQLIQDR